jgi:hypothetical protein
MRHQDTMKLGYAALRERESEREKERERERER